MSLKEELEKVQKAFRAHALLSVEQRNRYLIEFSKKIVENKAWLLSENEKDCQVAKGSLKESLYNRLVLNESKISEILLGIQNLVDAKDPVGQVLEKTLLDDALVLEKKSVPIGVIGIIFESRPDVIPQILSLIMKSSNAVILKGGSEALHSNKAFMQLIQKTNDLFPEIHQHWALLLESRAEVKELLSYDDLIDLIVPRGSNELVRYIKSNTQIPVIGHSDGICHVYVHKSADIEKALGVVLDSKVQYPSACNALETLLVDQEIADAFLKKLYPLMKSNGVELRACAASRAVLSEMNEAQEDDWSTEYGELILSIKLVEDLEDAVDHIERYSSQHTDCILAEDQTVIDQFLLKVSSASVFANASTRFADGYRFGLGAELGISTSKLHARGPVGIEGLCTYQYVLQGSGQRVADYSGKSAQARFKHKKMKS